MGIYNRDYMQDEADQYGRPRRASGPRSWSVVTWIIVLNILVHLFQVLTYDHDRIGTISRSELFGGHAYLLLTYQFVHADLFHLLFNMLVLYFWGYQLQRMIGTRHFVGLYFGAGFFGGLLQVLYSPTPILGASAAVIGVVFAFISLMPKQVMNLLLFFVVPIRTEMWKLGAVIVAIEVAMFLSQEVFGMQFGPNGIANVAHLGGAFFGWFWIAWILPFFQQRNEETDRTGRWSQAFGTKRVVDAEVTESAPRKNPKAFVTMEIDAILDKISEHGMQSLSEEEKKILEKGSSKLNRKIDGK